MADLWLATAVVSLVALAAGVGGFAVARRGGPGAGSGVLTGCLALIAAYLWGFRDTPWVTWLLPVSAAVILGNPLPWLTAAGAGALGGLHTLPRWRRALLATPLLVFGWEGPVRLLLNEPPATTPIWSDGVAVQSTRATCTPAAAATLLRHHGIATDETEMAGLCLTTPRGTHLLGLYRGLKQQTAGTGLNPVADQIAFDDVAANPELLPAIVSVRLDPDVAARDARYARDWGWDVGVAHSIVLFEVTDGGHVIVGDPGGGLERWRVHGLTDLWTGEVVYLAKK